MDCTVTPISLTRFSNRFLILLYFWSKLISSVNQNNPLSVLKPSFLLPDLSKPDFFNSLFRCSVTLLEPQNRQFLKIVTCFWCSWSSALSSTFYHVPSGKARLRCIFIRRIPHRIFWEMSTCVFPSTNPSVDQSLSFYENTYLSTHFYACLYIYGPIR